MMPMLSDDDPILDRLAGSGEGNRDNVEAFIQRWEAVFNSHAELEWIERRVAVFRTQFQTIRLRGMEEVNCILVWGPTEDYKQVLRQLPGSRRPVILIALSEPGFPDNSRDRPWLILSKFDVREILRHRDPSLLLAKFWVERVPRRWLIPFNHLLPAEANMFFGRESDLQALRERQAVSFAVVGASQIGKTSLLQQHILQSKKLDPNRAHRIFYINFDSCESTEEDAIAQFLGAKLSDGGYCREMTALGLENFLTEKSLAAGGPLEILLDEVGRVAPTGLFRQLTRAAANTKRPCCRLIVSGQLDLVRFLSRFDAALELIQLTPFGEKTARRMIEQPLDDLGIRLDTPEEIHSLIWFLSGGLPHLLQYIGRRLLDLAIAGGGDSVSMSHLDRVRIDEETARLCTAPFRTLKTSEAYYFALCCLKQDRLELSFPYLVHMTEENGMRLSQTRLRHLCEELTFGQVLISMAGGGYRITNSALPLYARQLGFLDDGWLKRARDRMEKTR